MGNVKKYISDIPTLLEEWDWDANVKEGLYPNDLSHGSTKTAHWICSKGHHYTARIDHRCIMNSGCPYCAGKKPILGKNDLTSTHPHLIEEWDYEQNKGITPQEFTAGSNRTVYWVCKQCGHRWKTKISHRALRGTNCPVCAEKQRTQTKTMTTIARRGSLIQTHPELAKEWDNERNGLLTPDMVTAGSNKQVFWIGKECGHSWKATIANRVNGNGCPICSGKEILLGYNDLATKFPEIATQWHPTLNGDLNVTDVPAGSEKKVWWLCPVCKQAYQTSIYSRTSLKTNCPVCSNRTAVRGINDLATTHAEVAMQWHPTKNGTRQPYDVVAGCNDLIWWMCEKGHEWQASVVSRVRGRGCPVCAKTLRPIVRQKTYLKKNGSLIKNYPNIAEQWHPTKNGDITPENITSGSSKIVWWMCEKGHEWQATVNSRTRGNGCPVCAKEQATSYPEQVLYFYLSQVVNAVNRYKLNGKELDIFLPKLRVGIEYNGRYYHENRAKHDEEKLHFFIKNGIRVIVIHEENYDMIDGDTIYYNSKEHDYISLTWVIEHIIKMLNLPMPDIDFNRDRTKILERYVIKEKENSLATKYPWTIKEWDYERNGRLTPYLVSYGSKKKIHWKCPKCGYRWESVAYTRKKSGCPCCANKVVVKGVNDLMTTHPELTMEWDYEKNELTPAQVTYGSSQTVWWKCRFGHSWKAQIKRRSKGASCPICAKMNRQKSVDT